MDKRTISTSRCLLLFADAPPFLTFLFLSASAYFLNGQCEGVAFKGIPTDHMYPAAVLYNDEVTCEIVSAQAPVVQAAAGVD